MKKLALWIALALIALGIRKDMAFVDVQPGDAGYTQIRQLWATKHVVGRDTAHFAPDETMTRAEIAVLIVRASHGVAYQPPVVAGEWYAKWIAQAVKDGYMVNVTPDAPATRADVSVLLALALGY